MPIKIVIADDKACPQVFCDHCGEIVADATNGTYQWKHPASNGGSLVFFTHKECNREFEMNNGDQTEWSWGPLSTLPIHLALNLKLTVEHAEDGSCKIVCAS